MAGATAQTPFPYGEEVNLSITPKGVEILGTVSDMAGELIGEHLGNDPTSVKEMMTAMGDHAPGRKAMDEALHCANQRREGHQA